MCSKLFNVSHSPFKIHDTPELKYRYRFNFIAMFVGRKKYTVVLHTSLWRQEFVFAKIFSIIPFREVFYYG